MTHTNEQVKRTKLATSATKQGITEQINKFWYSVNYSVDFETGQITGLKGVMNGFKVIESRGRYIFINEQ